MFTGLVEEIGIIQKIAPNERETLRISADRTTEGVEIGDSISVNGACLTVDGIGDGTLSFYAMPETLRRTALGRLEEGSAVNLERAMSAQSRFGGHLVQGHVDGVGEVVSITPEGEAEMWVFRAPEEALRYMVEKGSICVDGISLTVVSVDDSTFSVSILPQTKAGTDLGELGPGDMVNLEADVIAKYVEKMVGPWMFGRVSQEMRSVEDAV